VSLSQTLAPVIDLVFPPRCPLCGDGLSAQDGVCPACWEKLAIPGEPSCATCGRPFHDGIRDGSICAPCMAHPPRHGGIAAATLYNDASRQLVLSLKHGSRLALAPMMARLMAAKLHGVDSDWLLVPVPLHRWRLWRRGFNQAAVLAQELARLGKGRLAVDALVRRKATPALGGLGAKARARAVAGAIVANPRRKPRLKGASVMLVDDVLTSGATTDACVAALKRAGAGKVLISCFSRVLDEAIADTKTPGAKPRAFT
jgi:ComF family protein